MARRRGSRTRGPRSQRVHGAPPDEPDLLADVHRMLGQPDPGELLFFVSTLLATMEPERPGPFARPSDDDVPTVSLAELVATFEDVDLAETTALLTVIAEMAPDEVLSARIRREVAARRHRLPPWLTQLAPVDVHRVVEISHVLGDGDNLMLGVRLSSGATLSVAVYIDHNLGTVVKDAFVLEDPLDLAVGQFSDAGNDPDIRVRDLDRADARVRIEEAIDLGAITFPPLESETWPACRPLVRWVVRQLPTGGQGYVRPEWTDADRADLVDRFLASPVGRVHGGDDGEYLIDTLLWFGCDYGPGDPLRWSPTAVEILLTDWLPRKVVADVDLLEQAPDVLRAFIRFSHAERGVRAPLTAETLAAVDEFEPEYQQAIRSPRPQGPAALLAAMGAMDPDGPWVLDDVLPTYEERVRDALGRAVGGDHALRALDADPLPDEPFAWGSVADDLRERLEQVLILTDGCCDELLDVEYRTACRRLLADIAAADPEILRRGRTDTAAAAIVWIAGKANRLFDTDPAGMPIKRLVGWFGVTGSPSTRAGTMLRALGVDAAASGPFNLGTPRYLVSERRRDIVKLRDEVGTHPDEPGRALRDAPAGQLPQGIDPAPPDPWTSQLEDAVPAVGWFPRAEFGVALKRWPQLASHWGTDDYATYVRVVQAQLLDTSHALGQHPELVPIQVDELEHFAMNVGTDPAGSTTRATFVADKALRGEGLAWPPRRNDPCWCGSGRKYKKCCDMVVAGGGARAKPAAVDPTVTAYEVEVHLAGVSPPVWRRFQIRADTTFLDLHLAIQVACGWDDSHLFRFSTPAGIPIARTAYDSGIDDQESDAGTVKLSSYFSRHDRCVYEYDFGDNWIHEVAVRKRIDGPVDFYRRLVDGRRAFPPEDCGGLFGYEQCVDVANGREDPEGLREWMGDWDPEDFDLDRLKWSFDR